MTLLALARKVYRHRDWVMVANEAFCVERYTPAIRQDGFTFDPERNPAQLLDVLCWLMEQDRNNVISPDVLLYVVNDGTGWSKRAEYHDNTPQSLAAAIVKAACSVAEEEE